MDHDKKYIEYYINELRSDRDQKAAENSQLRAKVRLADEIIRQMNDDYITVVEERNILDQHLDAARNTITELNIKIEELTSNQCKCD